jgi:hypothetical protein
MEADHAMEVARNALMRTRELVASAELRFDDASAKVDKARNSRATRIVSAAAAGNLPSDDGTVWERAPARRTRPTNVTRPWQL